MWRGPLKSVTFLTLLAVGFACSTPRKIASTDLAPRLSVADLGQCEPGELRLGTLWQRARGDAAAVAVVVHGLNLKPEKMDAISSLLRDQGVDVLRTTLTGHGGANAEESFGAVTRAQWLDDFHRAYCAARMDADRKQIPLLLVGYSLGGLVALDLMNSRPDLGVQFDRMVLLAPAISVRPRSYLIKLLGMFGNVNVPSFSPEAYRANAHTPMAAYQALFESIAALDQAKVTQAETPTLLIFDFEDELVSGPGLRELVRDQNLSRWKILEVSTIDSTAESPYHHLIIDDSCVGTWEWKNIREAITAHLRGERFEAPSRLQRCQAAGAWKTEYNSRCWSDDQPGCDRFQSACSPIEVKP